MRKTIQTMARAYQDICVGEDPWTALVNLTNACYSHPMDTRAAIVMDHLGKPDLDIEHTRPWAAFCSASLEFL